MKRNIAICLVVGLLLAVGFQITLYQNIERKTGHDDTLFSTSKLDEEADTLHRSDNDDSGMFWVIIRATNIPNSASFKINDCNITQLSNNEWALWCTLGGNYEKNRAKVYKTLFYGTDGSNPRFTAAYITNCQAIKTAHLDDVDKRGHYAYLEAAHVSIPGLFNLEPRLQIEIVHLGRILIFMTVMHTMDGKYQLGIPLRIEGITLNIIREIGYLMKPRVIHREIQFSILQIAN